MEENIYDKLLADLRETRYRFGEYRAYVCTMLTLDKEDEILNYSNWKERFNKKGDNSNANNEIGL